MNVYLEEKDLGKGKFTKKYMEGKYNWLFVNDKKDWQVKSLKDYKQKIVEEICFEISSAVAYETLISVENNKITTEEMGNLVERAIENVRKNKYGMR